MWRTSKYKSKKTIAFGITFDSKKEADRYMVLKTLEAKGKIHDLKTQVKFILIPAQREEDTIGAKGGRIQGKTIERECSYFADFVYFTPDNVMIVEDTKGMKTPEYIIKRKLMLYVHGIRIREV